MSSNRWLIAGAAVLALLIGGSIAVGISRSGETDFPAGSPESTVQRYIRAIEAEDVTALRETFSPAARERCDTAALRNSLRAPDDRDLRVALRDARIDGDRAEVKVRVSETTGNGPFESGSYDHEETYDLVRIDGAWLIDVPTWPVYCPRIHPTPPPAPPSSPTPAATPVPANR